MNLHSNLVIFKSIKAIISIMIHVKFTFQSGYIQILTLSDTILPLLLFTFQSGYIQI